MAVRRQFLSFAVIGGIGFAVDAGVLTVLSVSLGLNIYAARLCSFLLATLATWWLNRTHTFDVKPCGELAAHANEYARYVSVQAGGGLINLAVFATLVLFEPRLKAIPVLPLAVGSGVASFWNYFGARLWVYRTHH